MRDGKALTLHQPWASLITVGAKTIETRNWTTKYRGPLAIHAAKDHKVPEGFFSRGLAQYRNPDPDDVERKGIEALGCGFSWVDYDKATPLGAVVARCQLVDCLLIVPPDYVDHKGIDGERVVAVVPEEDGQEFARVWTYGTVQTNLGCWSSGLGEDPAFGDFTPGRFAWILDKIEPLDKPIPAQGAQRIWNWRPE